MTHAVDDITRVVCDVTLISGKTVICVLSCVCAHLLCHMPHAVDDMTHLLRGMTRLVCHNTLISHINVTCVCV